VFVTHPLSTVIEAHRLIASGLPDADVATRVAVPTATVRNWRRGRIPARARAVLSGVVLCDQCLEREHDFGRLPGMEYAQLLGLYLGDGCLAPLRSTYQLRIAMDVAYPGVIAEAVRVVRAVSPDRAVGAYPVRHERWVNVTACSPAWPCLLPQHGPGKKHQRAIRLEPWQKAIVDAAPGAFLRGLIHSDGWRGQNRVTVKGRDYAYPRYQFSNRSDDIRRLFTDACDRLGVAWRPWGRWHISVARRDAVALLDEWVGPKG
jgi:hypothetical protein